MSNKAIPIIGVILIALGAIALARGDFSFTKDTHEAKIGSLELSVEEKESFSIPPWAAGGAIVIGIAMLFAGRRP
jgi:hypothetical protein